MFGHGHHKPVPRGLQKIISSGTINSRKNQEELSTILFQDNHWLPAPASLKPTKEKMKTYEITFITKEEPKDSSVKKGLEAFGGKILLVSSMGQKTFVYPIEKEKAGFYTTYLFEMEPEKMQDFSRKLGLDEEILRHLIVSIKPSQEMAGMPSKLVDELKSEVELVKPELEIIPEPDMAIEIEPEKSLDKARNEEIVITKETPEIKKPEVKEKAEVIEEPKKEVKKVAKKAVEKETKEEVKEKKPAKPLKPDVEPVNEEERLEALDKKLEELLKD